MNFKSLLIGALALGGAAVSAVASAAPCGVLDAPLAYAISACNPSGPAQCFRSSPNTWTCDLTSGGTVAAGEATMVYNYAGTGVYSAWGTNSSGARFCCTDSPVPIPLDRFELLGTPYDDVLQFTDLAGANLASWTAGLVEAFAYGSSGNDLIEGSFVAAGNYAESLIGQGGNDTLRGNPGDDILDGGSGNDSIWGHDGFDVLFGRGGVDLMYGGNGDDSMSGGGAGDTMYGDLGNDSLCGDGGVDTLFGNSGDDILYVPAGTAGHNVQGGAGINTCGDVTSSFFAGCIVSLAARPTTCP